MTVSFDSVPAREKLSGLLGAWIGKIIFILVAGVVVGGGIYLLYGNSLQVGSDVVLPFVSLLVAALFALAPLLACFAHTISIDRQKDKLDSLALSKIKQTQYFIIARAILPQCARLP
jgi:hypothetical protein